MDAINREQTIKAIKELRSIIGFDTPDTAIYSLISLIEKQPTVDAVPVVQCKDCIWFGGKHGCPLAESEYFKSGKLLPHENDFCSYGERREKDEVD